VSDEIPERDEIIRSTVITAVLTSIFLIIGLVFWAWSNSDIDSPLTAMNDMNPFLAPIIEIVLVLGMFIFLTVTVVNIRLYLTHIRSGWLEIILLIIIQMIMAYFMFGFQVTAASFVFCLGFIVYLYALQD
jgi:hypothetical protein